MKNFKWLIFWIFILLYGVGVCIGSTRQVTVENQNGMYEYLEGAVSGYDVPASESIRSILKDNMKLLFCLAIGGFFVAGPVVLGVVMFIKGYSTGFAITAVLRLFGIRGLTYCMANLISAIIIVPALGWYSCKSAANIKDMRYDRREFLKRFCFLLMIILLVLIVDSGIRGYLTAILMKFAAKG